MYEQGEKTNELQTSSASKWPWVRGEKRQPARIVEKPVWAPRGTFPMAPSTSSLPTTMITKASIETRCQLRAQILCTDRKVRVNGFFSPCRAHTHCIANRLTELEPKSCAQNSSEQHTRARDDRTTSGPNLFTRL